MTEQTIEAGDELNSLQVVTLARKILTEVAGYRVQIRMRPYEKCLRLRVDDASVNLVFETFHVREGKTRTVFLKQGVRLVSYSRETGEKIGEMISWDEVKPNVQIANFGRVETPEETRARREWEADAYRVGSTKNPLDNAARTADQFAHPTMTKYWS